MASVKPGQEISPGDRPTVIVSANTFWNITNFRAGLIDALADAGFRPVIVAPDADQAWARDHGAEAIDIRIDRSGLNPFADLRLLLSYFKLIRRVRPRFFLGFTIKPNIYGGLAARFAGVPSIPNVSGLGTAFMRDGVLAAFVSFLYRQAFHCSKPVFFQNPDDLDQFVERRIVAADRARLLPGSGVDLDRFRPATARAAGPPAFLFVGRLLADKGIRDFVDAARLVSTSHPNWRFQIAGPVDEGNRSGIGRDELARWVEEGHVEYLGFNQDVRPMLSAADAVVLPSYYREGVPRSLLEAAAMARPVIAADVRGSRQIVDHGVNGLLCEPRNVQSLADAIEQLGSMPEAGRDALGRAGRAKVEREFGEERVISAYLEALGQPLPGERG